ncbi:MAG: hypothetical protein H0U36_00800 [Nocardioidaceae bacterium]|nr:hypothetical protein [Nocardioidaceae bacterium]
MSADLSAAREFILTNARLLDRRRAAVHFDGDAPDTVVQVLRGYRNPDGGLGHALEPDVRSPHSETTSALHGLEVLAEIDALDEQMVADLTSWISGVAHPDGGVPFVLPSAAQYPHAPWMVPSEKGSHLTFGLAGVLAAAAVRSDWLDRATSWCWERLQQPDELSGYWLKFALDFLDNCPDDARARPTIQQLSGLLREDGTVPVPGGTADEKLTPLTLSPRPGRPSRALFTDTQLSDDLDRLESEQQDDGGWTFDFLGWSPAQTLEWRGLVTLQAVTTLHTHDRL